MDKIEVKVFLNQLESEKSMYDLVKEQTKLNAGYMLAGLKKVADESGEYYLITLRKTNLFN